MPQGALQQQTLAVWKSKKCPALSTLYTYCYVYNIDSIGEEDVCKTDYDAFSHIMIKMHAHYRTNLLPRRRRLQRWKNAGFYLGGLFVPMEGQATAARHIELLADIVRDITPEDLLALERFAGRLVDSIAATHVSTAP